MREHETIESVRFCEVDSYGVAWHGHYLAWMEAGRNSLGSRFGLGVAEMAEAGYMAVVVEASVRYLRPARFNEELRVFTTASRTEVATLVFNSRIVGPDGALCATGRTVHALTDRQGVLQYRLPEVIAERLACLLAWTEGE
ncbi:thioesterase family protein [Geobacter sp. DSM 9736]|uniref:acyl-CoA thioesterase n=1 Tax=Geobacter sp. DSM 9736 TaxID=1277350 RepID=UPI000B503B4D|nr:acyl-CoA thioesterase [Geobacter sp. DSM 9736]SNB47644.1 acyl-CoA thioester hydrolase [Geobacter sp. DSM 9736]